MQYCRRIYLRKAKISRLCCRDKVIEQERQLRQAAEERLQSHLTDLYNNPEVNRELRERLPRAGKSDPLDTSLTINDNSVEEGSVVDRMEKTQDTPKQRWDGWRQKKIQTSKQMEGHRKLKKPAKKKKNRSICLSFFLAHSLIFFYSYLLSVFTRPNLKLREYSLKCGQIYSVRELVYYTGVLKHSWLICHQRVVWQ